MISRVYVLGALYFAVAMSDATGADFNEVASRCAPKIHPKTLGAIVRHESKGNPFAISDDGDFSLPADERVLRSFYPATKEEAIQIMKTLRDQKHVFGVGAGQINIRNFARLGLSFDDALDACKNLASAQTILLDDYARAVKIYGPGQTALQAAISAYNTGSLVNGFDNGYVQKVVNAAKYEVPELAPTVVSRPAGQSKSVGSRVAGAGRQKQAGTNKNQQFMEAKLAAIEVNFGDK
ncbi:lytic transglycosylase domain-containing protein [Herbaspirillum huttiense]|uniref:lytic transglycosylase domain-containing protein n=1 Tax=Herbaspirillum huttiense TaxID=863372 RepID=UPI003830DD55